MQTKQIVALMIRFELDMTHRYDTCSSHLFCGPLSDNPRDEWLTRKQKRVAEESSWSEEQQRGAEERSRRESVTRAEESQFCHIRTRSAAVNFTWKLLLLTFGATLFGIFVDIEIACFEETFPRNVSKKQERKSDLEIKQGLLEGFFKRLAVRRCLAWKVSTQTEW